MIIRRTLVTILLVLVSGTPLPGQEPTLEDTGKYLVEKLTGMKGSLIFSRGGIPNRTLIYSIKDVAFAECSLTYAQDTDTIVAGKAGGTTTAQMTFRVPVQAIAADSIAFHARQSNPSVSSSGYLSLLVTRDLLIDGKAFEKKEVHLQMNQREEYKAEGLMKALKHAVTLCGGKKDIF